jgi:Co/Zn/Cd efflux system component
LKANSGGLGSLCRPALFVAFAFSAVFTAAETVQGFAAGRSWVLFVDAAHNAIHTAILLVIFEAVARARRVPPESDALDARAGRLLGWLLLVGGVLFPLPALLARHPIAEQRVMVTGGIGMGFALLVCVLLHLAGKGSRTLNGGRWDAICDFAASSLAVAAGFAQLRWDETWPHTWAAVIASAVMVAFGVIQLRAGGHAGDGQ